MEASDMKAQTYKHYDLVPQADGTVTVYNPRSPAKPVYVGTSVDDARRFVRGYRDGVVWAMQAAL
jgi:hypothetical protein